MGLEFLFLLLPVAALSGWWVGRRGSGSRNTPGRRDLSTDYFKGLNYLLNEQPDKAIEVFVRMAEVDGETVDTHFALGNLFRRRGEVDRAIRIHQNLIARPTLSREQRNQALFELGTDYMSAGLFDRAEALFHELAEDRVYGRRALQQLLNIFQQEKDWDKAIVVARRLSVVADTTMNHVIAHYYCEQAEAALQSGQDIQAMKLVKRALAEDRNCARATLLEGRMLLDGGSVKAAVRALRRVQQQDPDYLAEVIQPLKACYERLGRPLELVGYFRELLRDHDSISIMLALGDLLGEQQGGKEAAAFITNYLRGHPSVRGMDRLIRLKLKYGAGPAHDDLLVLNDLTAKLLEGKPVYRCVNCGFSAKTLHWQCPGCKRWNTVKPIHGIEGE